MEESILESIKKTSSGLTSDDTDFNDDIIRAINSNFVVLRQLGVGAANFRITDSTSVWSSWSSDTNIVDMAFEYISARVRLMFDPPQSSTAIDVLRQTIAELEWRITNYTSEEG